MSGLNVAASGGPAWLQACDPRLRLLAVLLLAGLLAALQSLPAAAAALALSLALGLLAGLDARALARRLLALEGFMLLLVLVLPFSLPGETLLQLGPLAASDAGLQRALLIALKTNAMVLATLALVGTLAPHRFGQALSALGLPAKLIQMLLMSARYVAVIHAEHLRLRTAMRARGFRARADLHTWRSLGWLLGMVLVRSFERAERILAAMKCRGFDGQLRVHSDLAWRAHDSAIAVGLGSVLVLLAALEFAT